jgi:transcriptional regulator with XRE-family HTH domain
MDGELLDLAAIGDAVRRRMAEQRLSLEAVARRGGCSKDTVRNIRDRNHVPRGENLQKVSVGLGWSPDQLAGIGRGDPYPDEPTLDRIDQLERLQHQTAAEVRQLLDQLGRIAVQLERLERRFDAPE